MDSLAFGALLACIEIEYGFIKQARKPYLIIMLLVILVGIPLWVKFSNGNEFDQMLKFLLYSIIYFLYHCYNINI